MPGAGRPADLRRHYGYLDGLRLAYVGDGNNVAHSLMEAGALAGMHVTVAHAAGYEPASAEIDDGAARARRVGRLTTIRASAVHGADAVYTDVWVSMGEDAERERASRDCRPTRSTTR